MRPPPTPPRPDLRLPAAIYEFVSTVLLLSATALVPLKLAEQPDAVRKAADLLADYGWLAREVIPTGAAGGRPTERYPIHPALLNGGRA